MGDQLDDLLSPPEVQHQRLGTAWRGYRRADVEALLERVTASYERVWLERDEAARRAAQLDGELDRYRQIEELLRETLAEARRAADRVRAEADESAEATRRRAQAHADATVRDAQLELEGIQMTIEELRTVEQAIAERIRSAISASALELERTLGDEPPARRSPQEDGAGAGAAREHELGAVLSPTPAPPERERAG